MLLVVLVATCTHLVFSHLGFRSPSEIWVSPDQVEAFPRQGNCGHKPVCVGSDRAGRCRVLLVSSVLLVDAKPCGHARVEPSKPALSRWGGSCTSELNRPTACHHLVWQTPSYDQVGKGPGLSRNFCWGFLKNFGQKILSAWMERTYERWGSQFAYSHEARSLRGRALELEASATINYCRYLTYKHGTRTVLRAFSRVVPTPSARS